ncbi:hypothetical protein BDB00DRAFT_816315 [Zychaea mexicana]|uniref:uncharacterized protein n=1 Tax=Zychaea mexicana TaxID=64656 RepID=UPI0022FEB2CB|nr:uncharacterized protein BDB00DRAFT_816315 [Zychaea mexicana]KAI9494925.1 hypothetical protein BDB00DRAFT_816315 [Zychaea mexicana]
MSNHVTNRRPPWRTVLLGFLGFTDLPVKVNCWYCNQDSYLLPGSKQTEGYWHCNICENTNVKDEVSKSIFGLHKLPCTKKRNSYLIRSHKEW